MSSQYTDPEDLPTSATSSQDLVSASKLTEPPTSSEATSSPLQTFHPFPRLPTEIQLHILSLLLPPRIIPLDLAFTPAELSNHARIKAEVKSGRLRMSQAEYDKAPIPVHLKCFASIPSPSISTFRSQSSISTPNTSEPSNSPSNSASNSNSLTITTTTTNSNSISVYSPHLLLTSKTHLTPLLHQTHTLALGPFLTAHQQPPLLINPSHDILFFSTVPALSRFVEIQQGMTGYRKVLRSKRIRRLAVGHACNPYSVVYEGDLKGFNFKGVMRGVVSFGGVEVLYLVVDAGHGCEGEEDEDEDGVEGKSERQREREKEALRRWPWLGFGYYDAERYNGGKVIDDERSRREWFWQRGGKEKVMGAVTPEVQELARAMLRDACMAKIREEKDKWDRLWKGMEEANGKEKGSCERWVVPRVEVIRRRDLKKRL